ncbi:hypothetical protein CBR_g37769 [Chara braunii]|uniref:Uncharacterized protein n=1 Tax=Chara braunii TaxID=69332 RepID=A0A388LNK5_CHABU|nr:hypothetical protein CBR_g37769 [Chara braunii]|eukprot:GBG83898.1 hypothetical protein CBR_g37769 [Chara braunii]
MGIRSGSEGLHSEGGLEEADAAQGTGRTGPPRPGPASASLANAQFAVGHAGSSKSHLGAANPAAHSPHRRERLMKLKEAIPTQWTDILTENRLREGEWVRKKGEPWPRQLYRVVRVQDNALGVMEWELTDGWEGLGSPLRPSTKGVQTLQVGEVETVAVCDNETLGRPNGEYRPFKVGTPRPQLVIDPKN